MQRRRIQALTNRQPRDVGTDGEIQAGLPDLQIPVSNQSQELPLPSPSIKAVTLVPPSIGLSGEIDSQERSDPDTSEDEEDNGVLPRIGYNPDTSDDEEGVVRDAKNRIRIRPFGNTFYEPNLGKKDAIDVLGNAYSIMHKYYKGSWRCWSKVPDDPKNVVWWEEFKNIFFWKDKHAQKVRRIWSAKCSQHLRSKFAQARESGKRPFFVEDEFWEELLKGLEYDESFKRQSKVNKCNRASKAPNGIGNYCGGSKPLYKHVAEYVEQNSFKNLLVPPLPGPPESCCKDIFPAISICKRRRDKKISSEPYREREVDEHLRMT